MYNKIILLGNLTRDIEMIFSGSGLAIAKTAIATSKKFKSNTGEPKEEVCFVDIDFYGRSAEIASEYLKKGSKILVEGRLVFDSWTDKNGFKKSKHSVKVDSMQMLNSVTITYQPVQQPNQKNIVNQNSTSSNNKEVSQSIYEDEEMPF